MRRWRQDPLFHIGFLAALTGPDAGWGKPGLTGNQMFVDRVNSKGGLLVDGVRYPLKMHVYDDEADSSKALAGARELVEKYNVKFISAIGGAAADATHPYLTEKKVIYASLIATDIRPDRPYLLAGGDVTPRIDMLRPWYHKTKNPGSQTLGSGIPSRPHRTSLSGLGSSLRTGGRVGGGFMTSIFPSIPPTFQKLLMIYWPPTLM